MIISTAILTTKSFLITASFLCHSIMTIQDNHNKVCYYNVLENKSSQCWVKRDIVNYLQVEKTCMNRWLSDRYIGGCAKLFIKIDTGIYHVLCGSNKPIIFRGPRIEEIHLNNFTPFGNNCIK